MIPEIIKKRPAGITPAGLPVDAATKATAQVAGSSYFFIIRLNSEAFSFETLIR